MNHFVPFFAYSSDIDGAGANGSEKKAEVDELAQDLGKLLSDKKKATEEMQERREKPKRKISWLTIVLALLLVGAGAFYYINPPIYPRTATPVADGMPVAYSADYTKCLEALWQYKDAAGKFIFKNNGKLPASLEDFYSVSPNLTKTCPVSGKPFVFSVPAGGGYRVDIPDAKAAKVSAMYITSKYSVPKVEP